MGNKYATSVGGGVRIYVGSENATFATSTISFQNCIFQENTQHRYGSAISVGPPPALPSASFVNTSFLIINCSFVGNSVRTAIVSINVGNSFNNSFVFEQVSLLDNAAFTYTPGSYITETNSTNNSYIFNQCSFVNGFSLATDGSAMHWNPLKDVSGAYFRLTNTIIQGNTGSNQDMHGTFVSMFSIPYLTAKFEFVNNTFSRKLCGRGCRIEFCVWFWCNR